MSNNTFVDELYKEFLVCHLCSENYKQPKTLNCMHTFCADCLEMHYDMEEQDRPYRFLMHSRALSCPICRMKTELPTGGVHRLSDNFLVANLGEVINRRKIISSGLTCEICTIARRYEDHDDRDEPSRKAVIKCLDCVKMLCQSCADLHKRTKVTQMHSLFDVSIQKDVECKVHDREILRFYCETCEICICVLCTFQDHKHHEVSSLGDGLERHRGSFELLLENCESRMTCIREQLELIEKCEIGIIEAEGHIRDKAIEAIAAVRRREKELMAKIRETIGEKTLQFLAEKDTLRENLRNIETTFKMTDVILKGTSIELLMAKKEMHEKMNDIVLLNVESTPENLNGNFKLCTDFPDFLNKPSANQPNNDKVLQKNALNQSKNAEAQTEVFFSGKDVNVQTNFIEFVKNADVQTDLIELVSVATTVESDLISEENIAQIKSDKEKLEHNLEGIENFIVTTGALSNTNGELFENNTNASIFTSSEKEVEPGTPVGLIHPVEYVTPVTMEDVSKNQPNGKKEMETSGHLGRQLQPIQIPVTPPAHTNILPSPPVVTTKTNIAKNWMTNCSRRSSLTSSFEHIPPTNSSGAVKMLKGFLRMSDNGSNNASSPVSVDIVESVASPTSTRTFKMASQPRAPILIATGTAMEPVILTESGTSMSYVSYIDKETSTPHVLQTNKAVSTENQEMVDKGTSTAVDVTAAYRNLTTCRRLVTVSRGTCTPRTMYPLDRATSPFVWPELVNENQVQPPISNPTGIQISTLEIPM